MSDMRGHNSAAYGEELQEDESSKTQIYKEFWDFVNYIRCSGLPAPSRHVAIEIWLHMRPGKLYANPSAVRIAQFTGLSERTVRTAFKALAKAPFFSVSATRGGRHQTRTFRAVSFQTVAELGSLMDAKALATLQGNDEELPGKIAVFQPRKPAAAAPLRVVNPEPPAGYRDENPAGDAPFQQANPAAAAPIKPETLQNLSQNPAGAAPEAIIEASKKEKDISPDGDSSSTASGPYSDSFEEFWKLYPRRVGKGAAFKSWKRLSPADRVKAQKGLRSQLRKLTAQANDPKGNFCPHAATWIGQRRFDDEPADGVGLSDADALIAKHQQTYRGVL